MRYIFKYKDGNYETPIQQVLKDGLVAVKLKDKQKKKLGDGYSVILIENEE